MEYWLPLIFFGLRALSVLIYVVLDGYDLGVGILMRGVEGPLQDRMVSSIGPFWDANETWLVLGIGLLLVAFPLAHGVILTALYLPVAVMLFGLILRGVSFDFRIKAHAQHKPAWNNAFWGGSLAASLAQGFMLGQYIIGFSYDLTGVLFSLLIAVCLAAGYTLLGACWLMMKASGPVVERAGGWALKALWLTGLGIIAVSVATPWVSERILDKWFSLPNLFLLLPLPVLSAVVFFICDNHLRKIAAGVSERVWVPFASAIALFVLSFIGLGYSMFPYLVIDRIDIWQAASAPGSLLFILIGTLITLPFILGYTVFVYRVFWGRSEELHYD